MGLPTKGSRTIIVNDTAYRWIVSASQGHLRLIVERREDPGQRLIAWFHHHDSYVRDPMGQSHRVVQLRSISPALVRASISLGLERGWQPTKKGGGSFDLWDAELREIRSHGRTSYYFQGQLSLTEVSFQIESP